MISPVVWMIFIGLVVVLMLLDLGVFHRGSQLPTAKAAIVTTLIWITLALLFNVVLYFAYEYQWLGLGTYPHEPMGGREAALKYLTGYLLEEALSVDNLFVMALIFAQFRVPQKHRHHILFWGILGVLVFRGILIGVGIELVHHFESLFYLFGLSLVWSAWKLWRHQGEEPEPGKDHLMVRLIRRFYPVTNRYDGGRFFTLENGRRAATPMFVALMVIESTDVVFAFDSVPAVFSITTDPFLVFSSNIFAILGLRSLYFVLAKVLDRFHYLQYSLIGILFFIGIKMMLIPIDYHIPVGASLLAIAFFLAVGIFWSLWKGQPDEVSAVETEIRENIEQ